MSLYPYRIIVMLGTILVTLLLGYFADLQVIRDDETDLLQSEKELQHQLQQLTSQAAHAGKLSSYSASPLLLYDFLQLIHENDIDLLSISKAAVDNMDDPALENYQLILASDYQALMQFMQKLSQQSDRYLLHRFLISAGDKKPLRIELILSMRASSKSVSALIKIKEVIPPNPFCYASAAIQIPHPDFVLSDMRLLGVVNHDGKRVAIILFPNGVVDEFTLGSMLGKEGGKIVSIESDVVVQLPNQRQFTFHPVKSLQ